MEKIKFDEEGVERIKELQERSKKKELTVLIVEDGKGALDAITFMLSELFPKKWEARPFTGEDYKNIEEIISAGSGLYDLIILGGNLREWPVHPIYEHEAIALIPFILNHSKGTVIWALSIDEAKLRQAKKLGAHLILNRVLMSEFLGHFRTH